MNPVEQTQTTAPEPADSRQLVAYVVCRPGRSLTEAEARKFLAPRLPEFMVPARFVFLDTLPLGPNGKVDRAALPAPDVVAAAAADAFVAPRNDTETKVAAIWAQVLRRERIGALDDFFRLGGHSLLALQVMARVRQVFQVDLPLRTIFEFPTPAGLAEAIGKFSKQRAAAPIKTIPRRNVEEPSDTRSPKT